MPNAPAVESHAFRDEWKQGVYQAIYNRRDIRAQFLPVPVPEPVLANILNAAHRAPSVGFMQPWDFILIRDIEVRKKIKNAFEQAHREAARKFDAAKRRAYLKFKLEGILESPLNICVTCSRDRFGPVVIGRTAQPVMDLYSSVCAVQNLWLAARAEGVGVGWMSIIHVADLKRILKLPRKVVPVAYLCVGYVSDFPPNPELETARWLPRMPLGQIIHVDGWNGAAAPDGASAWPELQAAVDDTANVSIINRTSSDIG